MNVFNNRTKLLAIPKYMLIPTHLLVLIMKNFALTVFDNNSFYFFLFQVSTYYEILPKLA